MNDSKSITDFFYNQFGNKNYISNSITQIEYMAQVARLAEKDRYEPEMILACLVHNIGHLFGFRTIIMVIRADFPRNLGFLERIPLLVQNYVIARKYLAYKNLE